MRSGAGVASSLDLDSFTMNPAGMMALKGQSAFGGSWANLPLNLERWSVGTIDGTRQVLGGLGFDWVDMGIASRQAFHLMAAYPTQYGAFGASFDVMNFDGLSSGDGWYFTQTLGILVPTPFGLMIGIAAKNILDTHPDDVIPPQVQMGVAYSKSRLFRFSFQADRRFSVPGQDWNFSFGSDLLFKEFYAVRGGYHWNNSSEGSLWSVGLALKAPRIELSGFYTKQVHHDDDGFGFNASVSF